MPIKPPGRKIGLFGGSFNPAHAGYLHLAETAKSALRLDCVWWLVSPQNPFKPEQPSYESRIESVKALGLSRGHEISHLERDFGTQYTIDLIAKAQTCFPNESFVFLMGADNFSQLPLWRDWQSIIKTIPIAVIARPQKSGDINLKPRLGQVSRQYRNARLPETMSHRLASMPAPAWTYITSRLNSLSSTAIRHAKSPSKR